MDHLHRLALLLGRSHSDAHHAEPGYAAGGFARDSEARSEAGGIPGSRELSGSLVGLEAPYRPHGPPPAASPLLGLPRRVKIPGTGQVIEAAPNPILRAIAEQYASEAGLHYRPPQSYAKVDTGRAARIADAFDEMEHDPQDPLTRASYAQMAKETMAQYRALKRHYGLRASFIGDHDPYKPSPRLAIEDVNRNRHMWVYPTDKGYGQKGVTPHDEAENPLLAHTDEVISGKRARLNDIFRIVHDVMGHAKEGVGFRHDGEENAWRAHAAMYSPLARLAMTTETRGQNSWVNFGPHGEKNRSASPEDTIFAEQKIGVMPHWVHHEGAEEFLNPRDVADILARAGRGGHAERLARRRADGGLAGRGGLW